MKIAIGTDHRGRNLKEEIVKYYEGKIEFIDCSEVNYDTDDYPDFAFATCKNVLQDGVDAGIVICGTGIGISIAANKVKGIRCALVHNTNEASLAKEHNNANVLAFGADTPLEDAVQYIDKFISTTPSPDEKHKRRVEKILKYESGEYNEL